MITLTPIACSIAAAMATCAAAQIHDGADGFVYDDNGARDAIHAAQITRSDVQRPGSPRQPNGAVASETDADWQALGPFGGDVQDVAASPVGDPAGQIVLAGIAPDGSSGGTLYRSTDGGATWSEVNALTGTSVYSIAYAPDGTAYIGTIDGVWRSTDDGATWTQLPLGIGVNDQTFLVEIDPNDPQVLYAGIAEALGSQSNNLLKSTNGGDTWSNVTPPLANPLSGTGIAINPGDSSEIMAGFTGAFGSGGQVWFSSNGGSTWVNRTAGLPGTSVNDIAHDGTRFLVGGGQQFGSQSFGLYATSNNGMTWTALHDGTWPSLYVRDVTVDPNDADTILAATLDGVHISDDGGSTWTVSSGGTGPMSLNAVRHRVDSSTDIFIGANSLGVLASDDSGETFNASSEGIGALSVYSVAANPNDPDDIALAFQGLNNGGVYSTTDGGMTWTLEGELPGTRYNTVGYAPDGRLYALSDGPTSIDNEALYRREVDGTWTYLGPNQGPQFESRLWAMRFSVNDPDLILLGGQDFGTAAFEATIWRSTNQGDDWDKVYEGPTDFESVRDIEIVEDGTDMTALAAFEDTSSTQTGGVLRSTNNGADWSPAMNGLAAATQGMGLAALPTAPETFFLADRRTAGGGLFRTDDAGSTWAAAGYNQFLHGVLTDPDDDQVVYIMRFSNERVLRSTDQGASFEPYNDNLGNPGPARQLAHSGGPNPRLLLATGTGVYATDLRSTGGIPGDLNGSGTVDGADLAILLGAWGPCDDCDNCPADLDGNCQVDGADLAILLGNWG